MAAKKRKPSAGRSARRRGQRRQSPVKKDQAAKGQGGPGGIEEPGIRTTRLIEKVIRSRVNIPQDALDAATARQLTVALGANSASNREATSAYKSLLTALQINMEQERRDLEIPDFHEHKVDAAIAVTEVVQLEGDEWYGRSPAPKANRPAKGA